MDLLCGSALCPNRQSVPRGWICSVSQQAKCTLGVDLLCVPTGKVDLADGCALCIRFVSQQGKYLGDGTALYPNRQSVPMGWICFVSQQARCTYGLDLLCVPTGKVYLWVGSALCLNRQSGPMGWISRDTFELSHWDESCCLTHWLYAILIQGQPDLALLCCHSLDGDASCLHLRSGPDRVACKHQEEKEEAVLGLVQDAIFHSGQVSRLRGSCN